MNLIISLENFSPLTGKFGSQKILSLGNDTSEENEFISFLSEYTYNEKPISIELYRKSCESLQLEAIRTVKENAFELLRCLEYDVRM